MTVEENNDKNLQQAVGMLKLMSNSARLSMLCHLLQGELDVGTICEKVGLSQSAVSQHLARLRGEGLVAIRRESQKIYYSIASEEVEAVLGTLHDLYCPDIKLDGKQESQ